MSVPRTLPAMAPAGRSATGPPSLTPAAPGLTAALKQSTPVPTALAQVTLQSKTVRELSASSGVPARPHG